MTAQNVLDELRDLEAAIVGLPPPSGGGGGGGPVETSSGATGTATVIAGTSSLVVTHGLPTAPTDGDILLTPLSDTLGSRWWVSAVGSIAFTIHLDYVQPVDVSFAWTARLAAATTLTVPSDPVPGIPGLRSLGLGPTQAMPGDHLGPVPGFDRNILVWNGATSKFEEFGAAWPSPLPLRGAYLRWQPPATGWNPAMLQKPFHLSQIYLGTDAPSGGANSIHGLSATTTYGQVGQPAPLGTVHTRTSEYVVNKSSSQANEHCIDAGFFRFEASVDATPGRAWFTDWNLHGPIGVQPGLLNGVSMFLNNYFNGSPADTPSASVWVMTKPGSGGAASAAHLAATTYPIDVGVGIIGQSGPPGVGGTNGFTTGLRVGGTGSGWSVTVSRFGTCAWLTDYASYGLRIGGRQSGATGPAVAVEAGNGPVLVGATVANYATTGLEVHSDTADADPVAFFGAAGANSRNITVAFRTQDGLWKLFVAKTANSFLTATAAGDGGVQVNTSGKKWHVGGSLKVVTVSQDDKLGFFAATPVLQQTVSAAASDAGTTQTLANSLRTALLNLGLCV